MMRLFITAKPRAKHFDKAQCKEGSVEKIDDTHFVVAVKESPIQGRANKAIIEALADFLNIAPSRLKIISGHTTRQKVIEIL